MTAQRFEVAGVLDLDGKFSHSRGVFVYTEDDAMATARTLVEGMGSIPATHRHAVITKTVVGRPSGPFSILHVKRADGETVVGSWTEFDSECV